MRTLEKYTRRTAGITLLILVLVALTLAGDRLYDVVTFVQGAVHDL